MTMRKTYRQLKEELRNEAINWQAEFETKNYTWGEIAAWQEYFRDKGRQYGLLTEFRENGIC